MRARLVSVLALLCLNGAGCQRDEHPRVPVAPAEVRVQYKGRPAAGAQVVLVSAADESQDGIKPRGRVGPNGAVKFGTYTLEDGAPPGEYLVSIRWTTRAASRDDDGEDSPPGAPGGVQPDRLGERYSSPKTSGLKVTIDPSGRTEPPVLELK